MDANLAIAGIAVGAICGLVSLALILRFLWRVYDRGGPKHVLDVARALREVYDPSWAAKLSRFLPQEGSKVETVPQTTAGEPGPADA